MRVVIISDFGAVNGGAAKVAIESARGLAERGIDIVFACAIGPISEQLTHPRIRVERFAGEDIWGLSGKLAAAKQGIWNAAAHLFLKELLARQPRSDTVIHLHQWTKAFSPAAIAAAAESGLPVAITLHEYFSFCPTGGYFDFKTGAPCTVTPMSASCMTTNCDRASYVHKLVRVARQWRSDEALRSLQAPLFIHVSAFARSIAEAFLPKHARHVVIENMTNAPRREPADVAANHSALYLGRFTQEKGVLAVASATARVGMPLRLVGEGDTAIKAEIRQLNPAADFAGWVAPDKVVDEIRAARCLLAPSLWYETGPMTVVEAMAQGVPVIVTRNMGAAEQVCDDRTGFVVDRDEGQAGLERALRAMASENVAARLGLAAYDDYWAAPLTQDRHTALLLEAYGRLTETGGARASVG